GHDPNRVRQMALTRRNEPFLPGIELPESWRFETDIQKSIADAELVLIVVPSKAFREIATHLRHLSVTVVTATKGIEYSSGLTMGGILKELLASAPIAALSGPSLSPEVARGAPTAVVAASDDPATAELVQH